MIKDWRDADHGVSYYYLRDTGRIVGQVWNMAHTHIYGAKATSEANEERILGHYITFDHAKKAVENFWNIQERTLTHETTS